MLASGIGLVTAELLASHGATFHSFDVLPVGVANEANDSGIYHRKYDMASWPNVLAAPNDIWKMNFASIKDAIIDEV